MALSRNLQNLQTKLQKKYDESFATTADNIKRVVTFNSTGSLMLDGALGGGWPSGRLIEVYGPESAGKTSTVLISIGRRQQIENKLAEEDKKYKKKYCVFVDAEKTFDPKLAAEYGVILEDLIYIDTVTAEQSMDLLRVYIDSNEIALAVVDSVAALNPAQIEDASFEQQSMGVQARFMANVCRSFAGIVAKTDCTLIFINQIREKIGSYGNPETTPGGRSLKFYSSIRLTVRQGDPIKLKDQRIGHQLKFNVIKNKVSDPYKVAATNLMYGVGIDNYYETMEQSFLVDDIWFIGGSWYTYVDENGEIPMNEEGKPLYKFQGKNKVAEAFSEDENLYSLISNRLKGITPLAESMSEEEIELIKLHEKEEQKEKEELEKELDALEK